MNRFLLQAQRPLYSIIVIGGFFVLWEFLVYVFSPPTYLLPSPLEAVSRFLGDPGLFLWHGMHTLGACLAGFGIAMLIGLAAALGIVLSRFLDRTLFTLLVALNSVPKIAMAPLFVVWVGTGPESKIAVSATIALWAVVIDTVLGLRSTDPDALDMARSMRASRVQEFLKIRVPAALPAMFAGMKIAISMALVGVVVGEFITSQEGLGFLLMFAQGTFDARAVYVCIILLGIMGTALFYAIDLLERYLIPWHISVRGAEYVRGVASA